MKKIRGFSLIELLVVMVIIGVLAGIGVSQFKTAQRKAIDAKILAANAQMCKQAMAACTLKDDVTCFSYDQCMKGEPSNLSAANNGVAVRIESMPLLTVRSITKVIARVKMDDTLFVLFKEPRYGHIYFGASNPTNGLYHSGSGTNIVTRVDGRVVTSLEPFKNDGLFHLIEFDGLNLQHWENPQFTGYGGGWNLNGAISSWDLYAGDELLAAYRFLDNADRNISDLSKNEYPAILRGNNPDLFWNE